MYESESYNLDRGGAGLAQKERLDAKKNAVAAELGHLVVHSAPREALDSSLADGLESPVAKQPRPRKPRRPAEGVPPPLQSLTFRELDVLGLGAIGLHNPEIASRLCIVEETVKFHMSNIFKKLGVADRFEASEVAVKAGLLDWAPRSNGVSGFTGPLMAGTKAELSMSDRPNSST